MERTENKMERTENGYNKDKLYYIVRKGTNFRITIDYNKPLIVTDKGLEDELIRAKRKDESEYEAILIEEYHNKYGYQNRSGYYKQNFNPFVTLYAGENIKDISWRVRGDRIFIYCSGYQIAMLSGVHGKITGNTNYGKVNIINEYNNRVLATIVPNSDDN